MGYIEIAIGWQADGNAAMDDLWELGVGCWDGGPLCDSKSSESIGHDDILMILDTWTHDWRQ